MNERNPPNVIRAAIIENQATKEKRAGNQLREMQGFFSRLSPAAQRAMKRAQRKVRGKRTLREIMGGA